MIKSMTGFGSANYENENLSVRVEIKTLNSKYLDASIKLPSDFSDRDIEVRKILNDKLERGKVALILEFQRKGEASSKISINKTLFKSYFQELLTLAKEVKASENDIFKMAVQAPDVITTDLDEDDLIEEWKIVENTILKALEKCNEFRAKEGLELKKALISNIENIYTALKDIELQEPRRIENLKIRLENQLNEWLGADKVDKNRFEQELIYYIEKLDINEEKVRLKSHLDFFTETINMDSSQGKKLGFISQEIGREINTIGSKANDAAVQKFVVGMKEELEKIKEQLSNII